MQKIDIYFILQLSIFTYFNEMHSENDAKIGNEYVCNRQERTENMMLLLLSLVMMTLSICKYI